MKRIRRARAAQQRASKPNSIYNPPPSESESASGPPVSGPNLQSVQSVIAEAELLIAELRRTIEWSRQFGRSRYRSQVLE